jgi:hypothetical protein
LWLSISGPCNLQGIWWFYGVLLAYRSSVDSQ